MERLSKILIILCIVLVVGLSLTAGMLIQRSSTPNNTTDQNIPPDQYSTPDQNTTPQLNTTAQSWHKIATYSNNGFSNHQSTYDLNIRGDNVRVNFSGVPLKDNVGMSSQLKVIALKYIEAEGAITFAGEGELNWGNELISKENSFEFSTTSRKIQIQVVPLQLESWEVNVWNYY
jgi:hypothetical protein